MSLGTERLGVRDSSLSVLRFGHCAVVHIPVSADMNAAEIRELVTSAGAGPSQIRKLFCESLFSVLGFRVLILIFLHFFSL